MCPHCMTDTDFKEVLAWIPHGRRASVSMNWENPSGAKTVYFLYIPLIEKFYDRELFRASLYKMAEILKHTKILIMKKLMKLFSYKH